MYLEVWSTPPFIEFHIETANDRICFGDLFVEKEGLGLGMRCYFAQYDCNKSSVVVLDIPLNAVLVNKSAKSISKRNAKL